jgi:hypothetical protein
MGRSAPPGDLETVAMDEGEKSARSRRSLSQTRESEALGVEAKFGLLGRFEGHS